MGAVDSMRTGEGEETSSRTPEEEEVEDEEDEDEDEEEEEEEEEDVEEGVTLLTPSVWSGDMAPSLLDSSSYCTYRLGCLRGSPSLVLLNISCPSVDANTLHHTCTQQRERRTKHCEKPNIGYQGR